jgi:hypothetical protein
MAGDYVPMGALCDQSQFTMKWWQGCFAAASK